MRSKTHAGRLLASLIAGDWDVAIIRVRPEGEGMHVEIQAPFWRWSGTLNQVEYHALIQRGIGELGTLPCVLGAPRMVTAQ